MMSGGRGEKATFSVWVCGERAATKAGHMVETLEHVLVVCRG